MERIKRVAAFFAVFAVMIGVDRCVHKNIIEEAEQVPALTKYDFEDAIQDELDRRERFQLEEEEVRP